MTAIKGQTRIFSRSPYFINCVPQGSATLTSATVDLTIQTGARTASVTSMTDLATYSLSSSNATDGIIVFDIAPLVADYFDHNTNRYDNTSVEYANSKQAVFVLWEKSVVDTSGTTDTSGYYVAIDGYSNFQDGVNYRPGTGATGNYGNPAWSPAVAKGTDRTIMATDCYRQMGENSYAIAPLYLGEFDEDLPAANTQARIMFGEGEDCKTYSNGNPTQTVDFSLTASDNRLTDVRQGIAYIPLGKQNLAGSFKSGYDYLRLAHQIDRSQTAAGKDTSAFTINPIDVTSTLSGANAVFNIEGLDPEAGEQYVWSIDAFTDCSVSWPATDVTASYQSYVGSTLTLTIDPGDQALVDCFANTAVKVGSTISLPLAEKANDIAIINDNPVLRYEIVCEPKYNVVDAFFINKYGAWDCFTFLKASRERLNVSGESYRRNIGEVSSNAYTYDTTKNSRQRYNVNSQKSITLNTGFVDESFSLLLEEMLVSERMFLIITDINGNEKLVPVNPQNTSVDLQTHVNDGLINYTLELEFAYDEINNVV